LVNVTISLVGSNNDTIELLDSSDYVLLTGVTGFGIPSTSVRIDESAGDGGTWRHTKKGIRELDLPIAILGDTEADVQEKLRRLSRLLQTTNGPTKIVADYGDGTSVFIEAHYVGGAETQFGSDATRYFCKWVLQMQAPQPYWQTTIEESFSVGTGNTGRGLLPQLTKLKVSSSQTLGVVTVDNEGDVLIYPRWIVRGPVTGLTISNGSQSFGFPGEILSGDTYSIDSRTNEVLNQFDENVYPELGPAPKFFGLPPGLTGISVIGSNTDANTQITCYYSPRYEVIH
jgi:phage-related protein